MASYLQLASADIKCTLKKTPEISIVASDTQVNYDHTKSQSQLDNFETHTVSPYAKNVQTHVGGLMSGEVSISQNLRMMQETFPSFNAGCLFVDKISVSIHVAPTVYIAREYPKQGCMYAAIMEHEKKHIAVDREIVNKYTRIVGEAIDKVLKEIGYAHGPYPAQNLPAEQQKIHSVLQILLKQYSDAMSAERQKRQQAVDTLQEYERVQALCRGKP